MKAPSVKVELFWIGLLSYWLFVLGVVGPILISIDSTFLVLAGIVGIAASAYVTYRLIIQKAIKNHEAHRNDSAGPVDPGTGSVQ